MAVEERRGRDGVSRARFPVGMRVLAVDDDPTCLKLLETLLVRCQYHVTTTNQAITALKMLRENRDIFDLVISDVHMPDMDGFKLLELVGLEMDLPVIMLSGNGETKTVMKGITHGAVDYLLKPVRIEELKNIWQHVIRKKKVDRRDSYGSDCGEEFEKPQLENFEGGQFTASNGSFDHSWKLNRKRKDQTDDDDEDDYEENTHENEDSSTQKKARVVWSIELHRKFVAAVNQLGIDKAVPKRILDLMNVEKLSRENVASHLQKYRLYLKRLSAVASQQANMAAALGGRDLTYLPMYSMEGFGSFHSLATSGQQPAHSSYQPNRVLNMTNPAALAVQGLARSGMVHFGHTQNTTSHPINDLQTFQHNNLQENCHGNLLQGMHVALKLDKFQQQRRMTEATSPLTVGLPVNELISRDSSNSFVNAMSNPLLLQEQQHICPEDIINHFSLGIPSISLHSFDMSTGVSSHLPDLVRCNNIWQSDAPGNCLTSKTFPMSASSTQDDLAHCTTGTYAPPVILGAGSNPPHISSSSVIVTPAHDPLVGRDGHCQPNSIARGTMFMPMCIDEDSKFLNFRSTCLSTQKWEEPKVDHISEAGSILSSPLIYPTSSRLAADFIDENQRLHSNLSNKGIDKNLPGQSSRTALFSTRSYRIDKSTSNGQMKYMNVSNLETPTLISDFNSNGCDFDELVNAMIKTEHDDVAFIDGDMGRDIFPLGACM